VLAFKKILRAVDVWLTFARWWTTWPKKKAHPHNASPAGFGDHALARTNIVWKKDSHTDPNQNQMQNVGFDDGPIENLLRTSA